MLAMRCGNLGLANCSELTGSNNCDACSMKRLKSVLFGNLDFRALLSQPVHRNESI